MRWGWLVAAAAVVLGAVWWWRRDKAMKGQVNTTGAPAGVTPSGLVAALATPGRAQLHAQHFAAVGPPAVLLAPVGLGTVPPALIVNNGAGKPAPAPKLPANGCVLGKKPTQVKVGSTTRTECR